MSVDELVLECADALARFRGPETRELHIQAVEDAIKSNLVGPAVRELLGQAVDVFRADSAKGYPFVMLGQRDHAQSLSHLLLQSHFNGERPVFYHGTTLGRLNGILRDGLVPGGKPVWNRDKAIREYSKTAVFLTDTWRGSVNWAQMAHFQSRGPRTGRGRFPVVLRVSSKGLRIEDDEVAIANGSFMFRGLIPAERIEVLTSVGGVPPSWEPLKNVVKSHSEQSLPDFRPDLTQSLL